MTDLDAIHDAVLEWYAAAARDLPWRAPDASPWSIFVSEIMLQQTPVARVLPVWHDWMRRWPSPADLAAEPAGEAVRAWGRLGYPRRALRLHAAATAMVERHDGQVPGDLEALRALPGVGEYTAAAVGAFAFGLRSPVIDTNIRRVQARLVTGAAQAAPSLTASERRVAQSLLPADPARARAWNIGVMELGALVCTARTPRCDLCPVLEHCAWQRAGAPAYDGPARRGQRWAGTDRQVRGRILAVLRASDVAVSRAALDLVWDDAAQRDRCLAALIEDGLVEPAAGDRFSLPA